MNTSVTIDPAKTAIFAVDVRFERLRECWAALKRCATADNELLRSAEWVALESELGAQAVEAHLPNPVLPPAVPDHFPEDGPTVVKAKITKHCHNRRMWLIDFNVKPHGPDDEKRAILWAKHDTNLFIGQTVYVAPNPNESEGGCVLHGTYNRYGDRLR